MSPWLRRGGSAAGLGGPLAGPASELAAGLGLHRCKHILWENDTGLLSSRSNDLPWALGPVVLGTIPCPGTQIIPTNRGGVSVPTENCNFRGLLGATPKSVALQWLPFLHWVHESRSQRYVKELLFQMGKCPFRA